MHLHDITACSFVGCFHPPVPEGVVYYSDVEPPENIGDSNITDNGENSTDLMSVFDHKDVLSFGCLYGFRAKDKPPQGQTFHTLTCSKGEWKGVTPVCNGRQLLLHTCIPTYNIII